MRENVSSAAGSLPALCLCVALVAASAGASGARAADSVPPATPVVKTKLGPVQGLVDDGILEFLGIPYAAPPVGDLRFEPPQPLDPWEGIHDATTLGAPCMQMYSPSGSRTSDFTRQVQTIFPTYGEAKIDNEDCLFLNVWTPAADDGGRPVMVWFHGGGYAYGSGGWPAYDGRNLAEKGDVVVVTVNHRLNVFGYLYLGDRFGEEYAASGNAGNLDLVASLEWVRDNIAAFGGDPDLVTIMGESGGGSKVSHLLATRAANGLFHRAIIQSGPGVTSGRKDQAADLAGKLLTEAGVETLDELRSLPANDILAAARRAQAGRDRAQGGFGPIVDGVVLDRDPFAPAAHEMSKDVPVMIGWNKDEMTLFTAAQPWFGVLTDEALDQMAKTFGEHGPELVAAYRKENPDYSPTHVANRAMGARFVVGTYTLADAQARLGGAPVYVYRLTWETPANGGIFRTPHTLEIPFVFDNVEESRVLVGDTEEANVLGEMMSDAWISFARTGKPSSDLLPEWTPYTPEKRMVMELDLEPAMAEEPERTARELLGTR
ncbi:MAG TPA: carboxylesterase/lipase family protein [Thermoanaerobaculia bacterium]|nr:carboxylesterase/lipase family protein [Thermoanaerobaculia bacterium]